MAPLIAVSACRALQDYLEAIRRVGGDPRVVDAATDDPAALIDTIAGVVLTGGADVDPARYGEPRHPRVENVSPERDEFEIRLTRLAMEADLPLLAICRGIQVLNVAFGGTLIQDIPSQVPGALDHYVEAPRHAIAHDVWISRTSRLGAIMRERLEPDEACPVNSRHHQAVGRLAEGFDVSATAPDGVIEAIERPAARFCIGVQWHPENFWRTGEFRPLFEAFLAACKERSLSSR